MDKNETLTNESDNLKINNQLSIKWHIITFLFIIVFVTILLYGIYVPSMKMLANKNMVHGDAFLIRAEEVKVGKALDSSNDSIVELMDAKILKVFKVVDAYSKWQSNGIPFEESNPYNQEVVRSLKAIEPDLRNINKYVNDVVKDKKLKESFAFLFDQLSKRSNNINSRLDATLGKPLNVQTYSEKYYNGLCYTALQDLLTILKQIRDLNIPEACYDRAMSDYYDAIMYSRLWTLPRFKMAELYRKRGWPEFAMEEYLRVIKLNKDDELAKKSFEAIKSYLGKHNEAEYYTAVAELIYEDNNSALKHFRIFLGANPTDILAPKADELIKYIQANNDYFIKTFIRDSIWI